MSQRTFQTTLSAVTDANGACTWTLDGPGGSGAGVQYTIAAPEAGAGARLIVQVAKGTRWGPWFGPQPFGPIGYQADQMAVISGSGLIPRTLYLLELIGLVDDDFANLEVTSPVPTGVTALVGTDEIVNDRFTQLGPLVQRFPTSGGFPTSGYTSLRAGVVMQANSTPIIIEFTWFDPTQTFVLGYRKVVMGSGTVVGNPDNGKQALFTLPHLGDFLVVTVTTVNGFISDYTLALEQTTQPFQMFGGNDDIEPIATSVPNATTTTILSPQYIFGGPAQLYFNPSGAAAAYTMRLQVALTATNIYTDLLVRTNADGGRTAQPLELILPAAPIRVTVNQTTGATQSVDGRLFYDLHRVG